ncbi:hypothetical protein ODJ79_04120 [Actinoplanes sp. KI2]|uniref:hypothetical protein n=1 Tax=Actinoplanes sp. KI2 TaxID=2983315 RepID=UPI0021D5AC6D|nr:hypothetical protein [Actinoplanes sp. KI2]MCU7722892.1 hypothetical protein [Actinoplanes sp. KI2]
MFLGFVANDRLAVMWWLIALRGLRRGEAAGLRRADVDLDSRMAMIEQQRIANGHLVTVGPPKTAASRRLVGLDRHTVRLLREQRAVAEGNPLSGVRSPPRVTRPSGRPKGRKRGRPHTSHRRPTKDQGRIA